MGVGCSEPKLLVGTLACNAEPDDEDGGIEALLDLKVNAPWSTSFESGICDYIRAGGFCYPAADGEYEIVTTPVHTGSSSIAFHIDPGAGGGLSQFRCVRQGSLPTSAYYGAWYFIPTAPTSVDNWNLLHFQGGDPPNTRTYLWDVSLTVEGPNDIRPLVRYFLVDPEEVTKSTVPVPIGSWFHLEFYLRRASDATGEVALYQNGQRTVHLTDIETDDTSWGQWYVGSLAGASTPSPLTVYVDDVTIRTSR